VARLGERERLIVRRRLLADDEDELSLVEMGKQLGVSRERARQLEARAKRQLREGLVGLAPELG
jgi:RNA polymerase sigma-32 factor